MLVIGDKASKGLTTLKKAGAARLAVRTRGEEKVKIMTSKKFTEMVAGKMAKRK